uniref:Uncharacterized protein n=1 Tax=viral metagenome TaxID=1070528 RepID=A0A6M3IHB8_9ZZZZ
MARCNAFYGEPSYGTTFYRCQLPKGHDGEHYAEVYPQRVYWHDIPEHEYTDREEYLLGKRANSMMRRIVSQEYTEEVYHNLLATLPVLAKHFIQDKIKREDELTAEYLEKYKTWRKWLAGVESEGKR